MTPRIENPSAAKRAVACARCGAAFACGLSGECWCAAEPYRLPMTLAATEDCLCPACLRKAAALAANAPAR
ncbi:MAG TPA: cysteine-rich CWC family protein [Pseudolabrys sp.]|nr:cysteine-rich CWC family protein [Pseudolabrys sp.]